MSDVEAARAEVTRLNEVHYALLAEREQIRDRMRDNDQDLSAAIDALQAAEQAAKPVVDVSGEVSPDDPPATTTQVDLGVARETNRTRRGRR